MVSFILPDHDAIKAKAINDMATQIAVTLGYPTDKPPIHIDDNQAAEVLGVKLSTLSVWRSTGRYNLPYIKVGRLVRYPVLGLAEFLVRRTASHTGEVRG